MPRKAAGKPDARRERNLAILPDLIALRATGLTQEEIAARLNAEGRFNIAGRPWTQARVSHVIRRYAPGDAGGRKGRIYYCEGRRDLITLLVSWRREGLSYLQIAARAEADALFRGTGRWDSCRAKLTLYRHLSKADRDSMTRAARARTAAIRWQPARDNDAAAAGRMIELRREGLTYTQIAARLHNEGFACSAGTPYGTTQIARLIQRHARDATGDPKASHPDRSSRPPIVLGGPGLPSRVLGPDGRYREKPPLRKPQRKVVEALVEAGPDGLTVRHLQTLTGDARGVLRRLIEDADWAAVIHPPGDGRGWRIGPPRQINVS